MCLLFEAELLNYHRLAFLFPAEDSQDMSDGDLSDGDLSDGDMSDGDLSEADDAKLQPGKHQVRTIYTLNFIPPSPHRTPDSKSSSYIYVCDCIPVQTFISSLLPKPPNFTK